MFGSKMRRTRPLRTMLRIRENRNEAFCGKLCALCRNTPNIHTVASMTA
jgi:hypothetical protein